MSSSARGQLKRSAQGTESSGRVAAHWILPGLIAGMVFAVWVMAVGIFSSNLWAPPQGLAQSVGIGTAGHSFQPVPFIAGLVGHLLGSVVLGVAFIATNRTLLCLRGPWAVIGGMFWGLVIYAGMVWVVLRGLLASTSQSFLTATPEWSLIAGHLIFGAVLGTLVAYGPLRDQTLAASSGQLAIS